MFAAAASPAVAKKTGVPRKVAKEFVSADEARGSKKLPAHVKPKKG